MSADSARLERLYEEYVKTPEPHGEAADQFFSEVIGYARKVSWKRCPDDEFADEVASDVVLRVFEKLALFKGDSQFSSWLYPIIRNAITDIVRDKQKKGVTQLPKGTAIRYQYTDDEDEQQYCILETDTPVENDPANNRRLESEPETPSQPLRWHRRSRHPRYQAGRELALPHFRLNHFPAKPHASGLRKPSLRSSAGSSYERKRIRHENQFNAKITYENQQNAVILLERLLQFLNNERDKEILELRLEDQSFEEISNKYGKSKRWAENRFNKIREQLLTGVGKTSTEKVLLVKVQNASAV